MGTSVGTSGAESAATARMVTELVRLHAALQGVSLPLDTEVAPAARAARGEMVAQLEDYVIPRMMTIDAPLLAVVGGSTGAGKSTLVNSLVGATVTTPGLLRPTTRSPVLVHHPADAHWFGQDRLLPQLVRVDHATDDPKALQLVATELLKPGLALLDAPDVDSVEEQNRLLAAELLAAADLWLFVTSSARYADQVPWEFLKAAAERSTSVAVVLDRTPVDAVQTVATHLARMLAARGLKDSPLFIVHEGGVSEEGRLPKRYVAEIRGWIDLLADDAAARHAVVAQTLDGAVRALTFNVHKIADATGSQATAVAELREAAASAYTAAAERLAASTDGTLLRGDVLARWQELSGGDQALILGDAGAKGAAKVRPQIERLARAVASAIELLVLEQSESAVGALATSWSATPAGKSLLAAGPDLGRASRSLRAATEKAVAGWQAETEGLVSGEPGPAAVLQVDALSGKSTAHRLLVAAYGEESADRLVGQARDALHAVVAGLLSDEGARSAQLLDGLALDADAPARLRHAARRVDDVRWASQRADPLGL